MSRSSYERTPSKSSSSGVHDRDYDDRKDRERERQRSADRYDAESRHHGKWTAQSETEELESSGLPSAYSDARRSAHLGSRSYSERENYDRDYDRRRSASYGNYDNYGGSSYGAYNNSIPVPPPMPPSNYYHPQSHYRGTHPYYPQFGHQSYDGSNYAGVHPQSNHHLFHASGNLARDLRAHAPELMHSLQGGYGGYGGYQQQPRDLGFGYAHTYGYDHPDPVYPSALYGEHPAFGLYEVERSLPTQHIGLGTTRPHVDIYELGQEYIIELDLPGHTRDHIETKLFGNELVITSRPPKREHQFHINERPLGRHEVSRKFYLPTDVATSKIGATLTNGVLRVVLPRGSNVVTTPTTTTVVDTTGTTTTTTQAVVV